MSACKEVVELPILTSCVDVKVGWFVGYIARRLQTWSSSVDLAGVTQVLRHVHCVGALVDVLTSKQHFHLRIKTPRQIFKTLSSDSIVCRFNVHIKVSPCGHPQLWEHR